VFESDARHLLAQGLPYDRCQIGIVTRMPRATGLDDLYPGGDEKMPGYIRTQIDVVLPEGTAVLNAAEPEVAALADYCDGSVMFYADDEHNTRLQAHRSAGHRVGFWREGQLVLAQGPKEHLVLSTHRPAVARLLKTGSLNTRNLVTIVSLAILVGTELIGVALAVADLE
jgi:cyanophycin synthetase